MDHELKNSKRAIWEDYRGEEKGMELCNYIPISNNKKVILEVCVISVTKGCACLAKFTRKVKEVHLEQQLYEICMFTFLNIYKYIIILLELFYTYLFP